MCGIAGIYNIDGGYATSQSLQQMCDVQRHRGPDAGGFLLFPELQTSYSKEPAPIRICDKEESRSNGQLQKENKFKLGFGHRRLAIIDLSEAGHQPMANETGLVWITYNGEIYNFQELRRELTSWGHTFRTDTDTEVIIHAYEQWGEACVERFNGMWAFAIWDSDQQHIFLSRDRFGIKPLYYYADPDEFIFASEIKAILSVRDDQRIPNIPYIARFISHGLMDHGTETFFQNVKSVPPGHSLRVSQEGIHLKKYWKLKPSDGPLADREHGRNDLKERFYALLKDAVTIRLTSDVPLGSCLSGGLDSSAIISIAASSRPNLPCFTSFFEAEGWNEAHHAETVANRFQTDSHWIKPRVSEFEETLRNLIWYQDEPCAAYGTFPQWNVMEEASKHVRVLLDGQGGDELLGGYLHFLPHYLTTLKQDPRYDRSCFQSTQKHIHKHFSKELATPYDPKYGDQLESRLTILSSELNAECLISARNFNGPFSNHLDNVLYYSLTRDILPSLLHYQDRLSMAFSIESRVPFLDYRLVEFAFSIPYDEKISNGTTKLILRKSMEGRLPESVRLRRDKMGYPAPLAKWIRSDLKDPIQNILFSTKMRQRGILNHKIMGQRYENHLSGKADHTWEIWRWLTLETWFRKFIDNKFEAVSKPQMGF